MYLQVNSELLTKKENHWKDFGSFLTNVGQSSPNLILEFTFKYKIHLYMMRDLRTYLESFIRKNSWILTAQLSFKGSASAHLELEN